MNPKNERTESRIIKLFNQNRDKKFTFEGIRALLPEKTRKEKINFALEILIRQKKIREVSKNTYQFLSAEDRDRAQNSQSSKNYKVYEGIVDISNSGRVFVVVDGLDKDPLLNQRDKMRLFNGDKVKIEVAELPPHSTKRPEGRLLEVVSRNVLRLVGKVDKWNRDFFVVPISSKIKQNFFLEKIGTENLKQDDYVEVEFTEWRDHEKSPRVKLLAVLDNHNINDLEMRSILLERGFEEVFPEEVVAELAHISPEIDENEAKYREDFRKTLTLTIDPADAKDFDDALSVKYLDEEWVEIGVHIADVSHYVQKDTALDTEALKRATSVYLPDRVAPMLPEYLSNGLCSLNPNEDRYAFSAIYEINQKGEIRSERIAKTLIHSDVRFSYEEAQDIIETGEGKHAKEVLTLLHLSRIWREDRFKKGALRFESPEIRFKLDAEGTPIEVYEKVSKDSNWLIEEFMLKANTTVAEFLMKSAQKHLIEAGVYRNHDLPNIDKINDFREVAFRISGKKLDKIDDLKAASKVMSGFLESVKNTQGEEILNQLAIRCMAKAYYGTENIGHYGLAFEAYTHFTSPIRRYPDLLVHRLLQKILYQNGATYTRDTLHEDCIRCNIQEKLAAECEREGIKLKQVEFLSNVVGREFDGIVSGCNGNGFWVEISENKCEGYIEIASVDGRYFFDDKKMGFISEDGKKSMLYGDRVRIRVQRTNIFERKIWFDFVSGL